MPLPHPLLPCILSILQSLFPLAGGTALRALLTLYLSKEKIQHPAFELKELKNETTQNNPQRRKRPAALPASQRHLFQVSGFGSKSECMNVSGARCRG